MRDRPSPLRGGVAAPLVVVATAMAALPSCGKPFEPPCRVASRRATPIDRDADAGLRRVGSTSLTERSADTGEVAVVGFTLARDDADAGADAGAPLFTAPDAVVHLFRRDGTLARSAAYPAPSRLAARKGSTFAVGATFTGGGVLFHWIERTVTTAPDGQTTSSAAFVLQSVSDDGVVSPASAPSELACSDCALDVSVATVESVTAALVVETSDASAAGRERRVRIVTFDAEGQRQAALDLTALAAAASPPAPGVGGIASPLPLRLTVQRGLFLVRLGNVATFLSPAQLSAGRPVTLPTTETELDLAPDGDRLTLVFNESSLGTTDAAPVGGLPDLYVEARSFLTGERLTSRRVTASFTALDVRRSGLRTGIVHRATSERVLLSLVDDAGRKIGGDLDLFPASPRDVGSGVFDRLVGDSALQTTTAASFVWWSAGADVVREEIACDP